MIPTNNSIKKNQILCSFLNLNSKISYFTEEQKIHENLH